MKLMSDERLNVPEGIPETKREIKEKKEPISVKDFEKEKWDAPSKVLQRLASHPMIDVRVKELVKFSDSPAYTRNQNMQ